MFSFKRKLVMIAIGAFVFMPIAFAWAQESGTETSKALSKSYSSPSTAYTTQRHYNSKTGKGYVSPPVASRYQDRAYRSQIPREYRTAVIQEQGDFKILDKNGNGKLSVREFQSSRPEDKLFSEVDRNGDIFLSKKEVEAYKRNNPDGSWNFEALNEDRNTHVSKKEFQQLNNRSPMVFDILDYNHNKSLSKMELRSYASGSGKFKR